MRILRILQSIVKFLDLNLGSESIWMIRTRFFPVKESSWQGNSGCEIIPFDEPAKRNRAQIKSPLITKIDFFNVIGVLK